MHDPMTAQCECEHVDHFGHPDDRDDCHGYGQEFNLEDMTQVTTEFGRFTVCCGCAETCLKDQQG